MYGIFLLKRALLTINSNNSAPIKKLSFLLLKSFSELSHILFYNFWKKILSWVDIFVDRTIDLWIRSKMV